MTLLETTLHSPLLDARGVLVIDLLSASELAALQTEAAACRSHAVEARDEGALDAWDRGNPDRWLEQAAGGPVLDRYLQTDRLTSVLLDLTFTEWEPLGARGSYSYYDRPGHYLGMHRDIVSCDLTVIICIDVQRSPDTKLTADDDAGDGGGILQVHPWAVRTALDRVRVNPHRAVNVELRPGQAAILLGGMIPHELTAIEGSVRRTVAPLCFLPLRES